MTVLTIGNFDGVHLGHRAILRHARNLADQHHAQLVALTFDPHPAATLRPGSQPPRISTLEHKRQLLLDAGADHVHVLEPTAELLSQSPETFIQTLVQQYSPVAFVEGHDFRFGKARRGDIPLLEQLGQQHNFSIHIIPPQHVTLSDMHRLPVSSSIIRRLVGHGRVLDASLALARPFCLTGNVIHGDHQARTLDIPTANLDPASYAQYIIPADGVYTGHVTIHPDNSTHPAAISVGNKPTFNNSPRLTIEAHLLDFADDLYNQTLTFTFSRWLRDQYPFPNIPALKQQLQRDLTQTRHLLNTTPPTPNFSTTHIDS